jgi:hypothetical protein
MLVGFLLLCRIFKSNFGFNFGSTHKWKKESNFEYVNKKKNLVLVWATFLLQENFSQFLTLKLELLHVLEKKWDFKMYFAQLWI